MDSRGNFLFRGRGAEELVSLGSITATSSLFPLAMIAHIILTPSSILNSQWHHDTAHDFVSARFIIEQENLARVPDSRQENGLSKAVAFIALRSALVLDNKGNGGR